MKLSLLSTLLALFAGNALAADAADNLLPVEQAFKVEAKAVDRGAVQFDFKIADDYYLYRERVKVKSNDANVTLGALDMPAGEKKHDEFLGDVEVYPPRIHGDAAHHRAGGCVEGDARAALSGLSSGRTENLLSAAEGEPEYRFTKSGKCRVRRCAHDFARRRRVGEFADRQRSAAAGTGIQVRGDRDRPRRSARALHDAEELLPVSRQDALHHRHAGRDARHAEMAAGQATHRRQLRRDDRLLRSDRDSGSAVAHENRRAGCRDHDDIPGLSRKQRLLSGDDAHRVGAAACRENRCSHNGCAIERRIDGQPVQARVERLDLARVRRVLPGRTRSCVHAVRVPADTDSVGHHRRRRRESFHAARDRAVDRVRARQRGRSSPSRA